MSRIANVIFFVCSALLTAAGVENPSVGSSGASPTAVPSANRGGLISNRQDFSTGNLTVTGNIGGGRHFRGIVPYGSSYYSQAELGDAGTSSIDDFLRRSADPLRMDRSPGVYEPYFQPRRAVTSWPQVSGPQLLNTNQSGQWRANPSQPANLPQTNMTPFSRQRPFSLTPGQTEQILSRQIDRQMQEKTQSKDKSLIQEQTKRLEKILLPKSAIAPAKPGERQEPVVEDAGLAQKYLETGAQTLESLKESKPSDDKKSPAAAESADRMADSGALLKEYKTYANLAEARCGQYMTAAQQLLAEGRFYRAADSFAMAAVWEPGLGQPYLWQGVSLFAAGEYMSSAYYIGRAFTLDPALAKLKIDLRKIISDRDTLENRLVEADAWQKRSSSGELAFLMAWVLWQDGKDSKAQQSLQEAMTIMGQDEAVRILLSAMGTPAVGEESGTSVIAESADPNQAKPAQSQQENIRDKTKGQP